MKTINAYADINPKTIFFLFATLELILVINISVNVKPSRTHAIDSLLMRHNYRDI
jgi:hypothetical protein